MLSWIIQITIISIILIFLVHYLINFFKSTLTVPKIKDLVNNPTHKYENIYNIIKNNKNNKSITEYDSYNSSNSSNSNNYDFSTSSNSSEYTLIDLLPKKEEEYEMKNELKNFLKKQLHS